jgi:hypothetical protein
MWVHVKNPKRIIVKAMANIEFAALVRSMGGGNVAPCSHLGTVKARLVDCEGIFAWVIKLYDM